MSAMRRRLEGTGPWSGIGLALVVAGAAMVGSILLSPHGWR